jgi:CheY-like chemotaxis protein
MLVVEDDDTIATVLEEICGSLGFACRRAKTLAEVRAAVEEGGYCGVLLDLQIPADEHARPLVGSGETALAELRKRDARRNPATDCHELPILAVTGYSTVTEFVARLFKAGVDEFIPKSFDDGSGKSFAERLDAVLDMIRGCFARAGRTDHAQCAALAAAAGAAPAPAVPQVVLELRGEMVGARSVVRVNGKPRELQRQKFRVFLRLALEHRRDRDAWLTHHDLGIAKVPDVTKRIRDALNPAMPEGLDVLETKYGDGKCRLNRSAIVHIDDAALSEHADDEVRKLIADRGKLPKKRRAGT